MQQLLAQLDSELTIETVVRRGDPAEQIINEAVDSKAGMIVMASHGRSGLSHFYITMWLKLWLTERLAQYWLSNKSNDWRKYP